MWSIFHKKGRSTNVIQTDIDTTSSNTSGLSVLNISLEVILCEEQVIFIGMFAYRGKPLSLNAFSFVFTEKSKNFPEN